MPDKSQSFTSHTRWFPLYHFFVTPIALFNVYVAGRHAWNTGGRYAWWQVAFALCIVGLVLASRVMALAVQDRLIRLEMRLKLRELLPAARHADIAKITVRQCVGLRFASDAELPGLVDRIVKGELTDEKSVKAAIKDWQADWVRA